MGHEPGECAARIDQELKFNDLEKNTKLKSASVKPGDGAPRLQPAAHDRAFSDLVLRDRLDKAIRELPVPYQVLINGHYLKGLRYEDLAEALNMPMGTVKTHLHRAKRRLRQLLETEFR